MLFRWLVFVVLIAVVVGVVYLAGSNSEPKYKGVSLSGWLERCNNEVDADPQRSDAVEAVRRIGPEGLPIALRWLDASDSGFKTWLTDVLERQNVIKFTLVTAEVYHNRAQQLFDILGPEAEPAIPGLAKMLNRTNSAERAAHILCAFGMESLPALMGGLTNRNPGIRDITAREMLGYRREKAHALPLEDMPSDSLLAMLRDTEASVRQVGARGIGIAAQMGGVSPAVAVPALTGLLGNSSSDDWQEAVWALRNFGSDTKAAAFKASVR